MSHRATEQDLAAAQAIARDLAVRSSDMTVKTETLFEAFGVTRITVAARDRLDMALSAQRVTTAPSVLEARRGEPVTLVLSAARPQPGKPAKARARGRKRPWYRRPVGITAIALVSLFVLAGALGSAAEPEKTEQASAAKRTAARPMPTPTPDPAAVRAAALAQADEAIEDHDFPRALAAVAVLEDRDVVDRYKHRIARRIVRGARLALRGGLYTRAVSEARQSRRYERTEAASGVIASAKRQLAAQRARKRARERAARLARDRATCNSDEKLTVRAGGGVPLGCNDYSLRLADRRAAREAQRVLDEAEAALDVDVPSSDGGDESGNWCGATRDGDGDGIWCEGR